MEKQRILLVEDNPNEIVLVLDAMAEYNVSNEVIVVRDGVEALDYLYQRNDFKLRSSGEPVLILADIKMPKMSGHELIAEVRAHETFKRIPIVVFSSSAEEYDINKAYEVGANAYVVKPIDYSEFVATIKGICFFWTSINTPSLPSAYAGNVLSLK